MTPLKLMTTAASITEVTTHMARSAATLEDLRRILDGFEGCALRTMAKQLVFADGNPQARLMFVGEAPGREEDLEGLQDARLVVDDEHGRG